MLTDQLLLIVTEMASQFCSPFLLCRIAVRRIKRGNRDEGGLDCQTSIH